MLVCVCVCVWDARWVKWRLLVVEEDAFSMLLRLAGPEAAEEAWGMCACYCSSARNGSH